MFSESKLFQFFLLLTWFNTLHSPDISLSNYCNDLPSDTDATGAHWLPLL